jgi:spore germination protein GerM
VGLVKTVYPSTDGDEIYSELSSVESDTPFTAQVRFYFPGTESDTVYYIDRAIDFSTNDVVGDVLAAAYKDVPEGLNKVLSENTKINSLSIGDDNIVHLDLSSEFINEMNAGSGYEAQILRCIANTFCGYCGAQQLILTIDGKPYSSGHFAFAEGEAIPADYTGVQEYK